jgi:hypothetical protein
MQNGPRTVGRPTDMSPVDYVTIRSVSLRDAFASTVFQSSAAQFLRGSAFLLLVEINQRR